MGAISDCHGLPVIQLRRNANTKNETTYVAVMWKRRTRQTMTAPRHQMTIIGSK